ncbi:MAG: hypothetical protein ACKN9B_00265, partial [Actinomycetes bacterium]
MSKKEMGNDLPKEVKNLLNRRRVLQAGAIGGAAAFAAACGAGSNTSSSTDSAGDTSDSGSSSNKVVWSNWPLYMPVDENTKEFTEIKAFTEQTVIVVVIFYVFNFNTGLYFYFYFYFYF